MDEVILPTVRGMAAEGNDYTGFLYAGLMIIPEGEPRVIEYNCRFGDPETQPIMVRLQSDLVDLCEQALDGPWTAPAPDWDERCAIGVVLAAGGYPGSYPKGAGHPAAWMRAGPGYQGLPRRHRPLDGDQVVTSGGRVLCVTALGRRYRRAQRGLLPGCRQDQLGGRDPAPRHWLARRRAL